MGQQPDVPQKGKQQVEDMPWPQGLEQGNHPWESQSPNPRGDSSCPNRSHQILQGRWQQSLLWDASYRGSLTPHNVQHPPQKVQISMCSLWTQNVTRYLPDENGQHCGPMPQCIGHPGWCVHLWKAWQRLQCKHHKLVQCGPKGRTHLQQQKMCHKTGVCNILWQSLLCRILPRSRENSRHLQDDTTPDKARATIVPWSSKLPADIRPSSQLKHWAPPALLKKENCFAWDENTNTCFQKITSHPSVWCLTQGARSLHHPGWTAHCFFKQVPHGHWDPLCQHWERTLGHHIWLWKIPHVPVWKDLHHRDRP